MRIVLGPFQNSRVENILGLDGKIKVFHDLLVQILEGGGGTHYLLLNLRHGGLIQTFRSKVIKIVKDD